MVRWWLPEEFLVLKKSKIPMVRWRLPENLTIYGLVPNNLSSMKTIHPQLLSYRRFIFFTANG